MIPATRGARGVLGEEFAALSKLTTRALAATDPATRDDAMQEAVVVLLERQAAGMIVLRPLAYARRTAHFKATDAARLRAREAPSPEVPEESASAVLPRLDLAVPSLGAKPHRNVLEGCATTRADENMQTVSHGFVSPRIGDASRVPTPSASDLRRRHVAHLRRPVLAVVSRRGNW